MNLDNIMDELLKEGVEECDLRSAYAKAKKRAIDNKRQLDITDKRSKVLAALTDYFITVFGKADKDLVDEFEQELIKIEKKADAPARGLRAKSGIADEVVTDDEKLRKFIDELFKY